MSSALRQNRFPVVYQNTKSNFLEQKSVTLRSDRHLNRDVYSSKVDLSLHCRKDVCLYGKAYANCILY